MSESTEVLITSDNSSNLWSCAIWDITTGTHLHSYKGGGVLTSKTVNLINNDYLIAAEKLKPLLHAWPINSQEVAKNIRLVCPGRVATLSVSNNGLYCAAGIEEKLYIWHIPSGRLLAIASKHFQPITKVLFTSDDTLVVSAGEDGLILIWSLAHLISQQNDFTTQTTAGQTDPIYSISDHAMPVKDLFIGKSGVNSRLISVSTDRTMKLFKVSSGTQLLSAVFDCCLTAVTMNSSETNAYVGTIDGLIYEISFRNPPRNLEYHVKKIEKSVFTGHSKAISCLSVSINGQTLASGSLDEQVIIWHVATKQKIRFLSHKGTINNLAFVVVPKNMFNHDVKPKTIINSFQRTTESENETIEVIHTVDRNLPFDCTLETEPIKTNEPNSALLEETNKLKTINSKLYKFTVNKLMEKVENNAKTLNVTKKRKLNSS